VREIETLTLAEVPWNAQRSDMNKLIYTLMDADKYRMHYCVRYCMPRRHPAESNPNCVKFSLNEVYKTAFISQLFRPDTLVVIYAFCHL
jgi:hypothetical protein